MLWDGRPSSGDTSRGGADAASGRPRDARDARRRRLRRARGRDVEAVVNDVRQGNVSAGEAAKTYGAAFELVPSPFTVVGAASTTTSDQGDDPA